MLVDAAKQGDVEIPVFCYEPKLGEPVGACRMCLVEIEGIPKLQTSCSTPVRDGMVVYTQTDQVKEAQNAVVEFLLVNHPLDCPVCDKGGECPLQDIAMGWGPGKSRLHRPESATSRSRSSSRRWSRSTASAASSATAACASARRSPRTSSCSCSSAATAPSSAPSTTAPTSPLPRQHHRALPGRGADLLHLPLPRPALGHRGRGLGLHAVPEPVQRQVHGPRRAAWCGSSPATTQDVDDGWLCDKGRFGFQMLASEERIVEPMVRGGDGTLSPVSWEEALEKIAGGLEAAGAGAAALLGGGTSNEEGWLVQRILRGGARLAERRRARRRPIDAGAGSRAGAARADGADPRHRLRRRDPRRRLRPAQRGADPRPADPQGGAARGRQLLRRHRAPDRARRRRPGDGALRPG